MVEARRREERFRDGRPPATIRGRTVLVVDDGLATGATMRASVRALRRKSPARLVVAVPVGSEDACQALRAEADEVVCPWIPEDFGAVGFFYENFEPTEDDEVRGILREHSERRSASRQAGPAPVEG
jgi:predicted phosphoribosyltransferase